MRSNNKYIEKVMQELDVYRRYLLDEQSVTLTPTQADTFKKIGIVRGYLLDGYSDKQILSFCKTDPQLRVQDRRGREILTLTYDLFADTRLSKDVKGEKYIYSEVFKEAAQDVYETYQDAKRAGLYKEAAMLIREWRAIRAEAGKIDKVYEDEDQNKKPKPRPHKVVFKKVVVNNHGIQPAMNKVIDIGHDEQ